MEVFRAPMEDILDTPRETIKVKLNYTVNINPDNVIFAFGDSEKIASYLQELSGLEIMAMFMEGGSYE